MEIELYGGPYDGTRITIPDHTTHIDIPYLDIHPKRLQQLLHQQQAGHDIEPQLIPHITEITYRPNPHNQYWTIQQ